MLALSLGLVFHITVSLKTVPHRLNTVQPDPEPLMDSVGYSLARPAGEFFI